MSKKSPRCTTFCGDDPAVCCTPRSQARQCAMCITPRRQSPRCATYRRVKGIKFRKNLLGVQHTGEMISAVCYSPWRPSPCTLQKKSHRCATQRGEDLLWCATYCGVMASKFRKNLRAGQHTTQTISAVCNTLRRQIAHHGVKIEIFTCIWLLLKGQYAEILLRVNTSIMNKKI